MGAPDASGCDTRVRTQLRGHPGGLRREQFRPSIRRGSEGPCPSRAGRDDRAARDRPRRANSRSADTTDSLRHRPADHPRAHPPRISMARSRPLDRQRHHRIGRRWNPDARGSRSTRRWRCQSVLQSVLDPGGRTPLRPRSLLRRGAYFCSRSWWLRPGGHSHHRPERLLRPVCVFSVL